MLQPFLHFIQILPSQIINIYDNLVGWMMMTSSATSHLIYSTVQNVLNNWIVGLPAAMPRHISEAKAQLTRNFRTIAEPSIDRFRQKCSWKSNGGKKQDNGGN